MDKNDSLPVTFISVIFSAHASDRMYITIFYWATLVLVGNVDILLLYGLLV